MPDAALVLTLDPSDLLHLAPEIVLATWGLVVLAVDFTLAPASVDGDPDGRVLGGAHAGRACSRRWSAASLPDAEFGTTRATADPIAVLRDASAAGPLTERLELLLIVVHARAGRRAVDDAGPSPSTGANTSR